MQNKWYYIKALVNNFNVNGNTIIGFCPQIQVSVYRTLIETCQVTGVQNLSGTLSLFFFFCSIFFASSPLSAGRGQAATHHVLQHEKVPN